MVPDQAGYHRFDHVGQAIVGVRIAQHIVALFVAQADVEMHAGTAPAVYGFGHITEKKSTLDQ